MKYDGLTTTAVQPYPNDNVTRRTRRRPKLNLLDVFIVQAVLCVAVSCGVMISRLVALGL